MAAYGNLCTEFYDLDKPVAQADALAYYLGRARKAGGRVLEPMCGSGRFLLPMAMAGIPIDGVDSSPAMLAACRKHSRALGIEVPVFLQELASLALPHRYALAFIPAGSIGLITDAEELRAALSRIRAHMEPGSTLLLEISNDDFGAAGPTELEPRVVTGVDGSTLTYTCVASRSTDGHTIHFSGTYTKRQGARVVDAEQEYLALRLYDVDEFMAELTGCGFRPIRASGASDLEFPAASGCTLIEAQPDA